MVGGNDLARELSHSNSADKLSAVDVASGNFRDLGCGVCAPSSGAGGGGKVSRDSSANSGAPEGAVGEASAGTEDSAPGLGGSDGVGGDSVKECERVGT